MATRKIAIDFAKLDKALHKHWSPVWMPERSLLENLLFACCLEDSDFQAAEDAYARIQQIFFDWNEIRVTSATELGEAMPSLADPRGAALRLKNSLQSVFEQGVMTVSYEFDLEFLKKETLGKAQGELAKIKGASPFVQAFVVQRSLGGHAIPLDRSAMKLFAAFGAVKPGEEETFQIAGLERAIPKNKGAEFSTLLHQAAVEFAADSGAAKIRKFLKEVDPDSIKRLEAPPRPEPTKPAKKRPTPADVVAAVRAAADVAAEGAAAAKKPGPKKAPAKKPAPPVAAKKPIPKKKVAAKSTAAAKPAAPTKTKPKKPR
jgi:endonuclease-3